MTEIEILEGVKQVLREHLAVRDEVHAETHLAKDLALDSLKQLTLVVEIENYFKICFDPGDEEGVRTLGDVVLLVAQRLSAEARDGR